MTDEASLLLLKEACNFVRNLEKHPKNHLENFEDKGYSTLTRVQRDPWMCVCDLNHMQFLV